MNFAICINCGAEKSYPKKKCPVCGFIPRTNLDIAKSIAASTNGWLDEPEDAPSVEELRKIGAQIKSGQPPSIREEVVMRMLQEKQRVDEPWTKGDKRDTRLFFLVLFAIPVVAVLYWLLHRM